jgi:hypothetical protein
MRDPTQPFRVVARLALIGTLTACPQLLTDGFELGADPVPLPGGDGSGAITKGDQPDAGVDPSTGGSANGGASGSAGTLSGASGAGGTGNAGGTGTSADEGSAGDAGTASQPDANQAALHDALAHRYRFDTDAPLVDSVGGLDAASPGATFSNGAAVLAGTASGQYIDLPNGLLSGLHNASFEVWVTWDVSSATSSNSEWQRIFDLGRNPTTVESQQCAVDVSGTDLYLTPSNEYGKMQLECESCPDTALTSSGSLALGVPVQLVAVVDDDHNTLSLYQNGGFLTSVPFTSSLSQITTCTDHPAPCDWNNWLGRSQHIEDPPFVGKILDFRVYSAALSAGPIKASFDGGADADW